MVQLQEEEINEFKKLYLKHFGVELSDKEALEYGLKLVNLVKLVIKKP